MKDFKDRYGYTYAERLAVQERQLARWAPLLQPGVLESTRNIIEQLNAPATAEGQAHTVIIGSTLASLILDYAQHPQIERKLLLGELPTLNPVVA